MKRLINALACVLAMTACGGSGSDNNLNSPDTVSISQSAEQDTNQENTDPTNNITESENGITVSSEFIGYWQNELFPNNYWVVMQDSITNFGYLPSTQCVRIDATLLSSSTFTIDQGIGAGDQISMRIEDGKLILEATALRAMHSQVDESDIPLRCFDLPASAETMPSTNTVRYTDSFLQIDYPADWILDTNPNGGTAQFLSPETNENGFLPNCVINSFYSPGSNLNAITNDALTQFDLSPAPEVSFLTVNDTPMSRTTGFVTLFAQTIDINQQLAFKDDFTHQAVCLGTNLDIQILNSMVVL